LSKNFNGSQEAKRDGESFGRYSVPKILGAVIHYPRKINMNDGKLKKIVITMKRFLCQALFMI